MRLVTFLAWMTIAVGSNVASGQPGADSALQSYRAHIAAAAAALTSGDLRAARDWLAAAPEPYRGWEWDHLKAETDHSLSSFRASDQGITKLQVSPDGKLLAIAALDGVIRLWETQSESVVAELRGHEKPVHGLCFSADGQRLASTGRDLTLRLWDVDRRAEVGVLGEHPTTPYACAFTPDGSRVVSVGWRTHPEKGHPVGLIRVWDVESRTLLHTQDYTTHPIGCVAISPDGRTAYLGCWEYQILVMNLETFAIERELQPRESQAYKAIDWIELDPRGEQLVTGCKDKTCKFFDLASGEQRFESPHRGHVTAARFVSGRDLVVTSSQDGAVRLVRASDGSEVARLLGHQAPVSCAAVAPNGDIAYSGDAEGMIFRWDLRAPESFTPSYRIDGAWSCVFDPNGTRIAAGTNERTIQVRDARTLERLTTSSAFDALVVDVAWSPDGSRIVGGSNDGTVRCIDVATGSEAWRFQGQGQIRATDWSRDGRYIAAGSGGSGVAYVLDAKDGRVVCEHGLTPGTLATGFFANSSRVAFAAGKRVVVLEVPTGQMLGEWSSLASDAAELAVSPDGRALAVGEMAGDLELFDVDADGRIVGRRWSGKTTGTQWGASFSPDGARLASIGYDFALHLWDPASGQEVFQVRDLPIQGFDVRFSPSGDSIAYMGGAGQTWLIDRRVWRERRRFQSAPEPHLPGN